MRREKIRKRNRREKRTKRMRREKRRKLNNNNRLRRKHPLRIIKKRMINQLKR